MTAQQASSPQLSVVATIYNAAPMVRELVDRLRIVLEGMGITYEIVLVDDCSKDDSLYVMQTLSEEDPHIKSIALSRNFGQQVAMSAGIHYARGDYVLIMDGDLQNPPEAIPLLYQTVQQGYDIIYTTSVSRNNWVDEATSWLFWKFMRMVMKVDIIRSQLMMRIFTRRVAEYFKRYPEKVRTIVAIINDIGMKHKVIEVPNNKRAWGKSNYNTIKRVNLAIDVLLDLSNNPLNILFYSGLIILGLTGILSLHYLYLYLFENILPGFTTIILSVLFFGSINLISLGLIARYISNIYTEVKNRPLFLVRQTINISEDQQSGS
ncbi:MAG: glycosyltransferase family 2 protein [Nitrosomonas sp.]|uniref:glycosyltransferase family 2 protein n=1 Tax=Nitrosomonas sp. TaxID=42353 RepID=UPI001E0BA11C|nr:glycosyltransferase family 2 protein [Nitrosomonas sp.]MBX9896136.1 glycosyltransferase family 2 protein [Nitrosomonas sp.]